MRLPTWEELSSVEEQLEVLEYPLDQSLFVVGPPGSGKTVLAMQRAQLALSTQMAPSKRLGVSLVTYNRMLRRLLVLLNKESHVNILTMNTFVWRDFKRRASGRVPPSGAEKFSYDWNAIDTTLKRSKKTNFSRSHLVVDEGQDLPQAFFKYASQYVSAVMTVFADEDQALGDKRTQLGEIKVAAGLGDPIILSKNHRNTPEISRLAEHFHSGGLPVAEVMREPTGELPRLIQAQGLNPAIELISNRLKNTGDCIGVIVDRNNTGDAIYNGLRKRLPKDKVNIYKNDQKNENSINVLEPGVTVLNKASVKGQEFDAVYILELEKFIPCNTDAQRRAMYMMCTRARNNLFLVYNKAMLSAQTTDTLPGPDVLEHT